MLKLFNIYPERYEYIILEEVDSSDMLDNREIYFIDFYKTFISPNCFNFTKGGGGGFTLGKYSNEERKKIKMKELETKKQNPNIMKNAAYKARQTFLKRPFEETSTITKNRIEKSVSVKLNNAIHLSEEEKNKRRQQHSCRIRDIHRNRNTEQKQLINNKISKTLTKDKIKLKNIHTGEEKELPFTQWKRQLKVDVYHLKLNLQKTSHGWALP
jgi:hypothetical protein